MKVAGAWLSAPPTQALCRALSDAGFRALFVGGCVRNALLGMPVADIDLCTDALPETVTDIAENAGFKVVPTGIEHGTVTVIIAGVVHEVTTFRRDVETDGRRAVVAFSTRIEDDAHRRDLTMNALYCDATGEVIDPLGALPDLLARRVRFVGDAEDRIREDYLRVLRFFRFFAVYGDPDGGIDVEGLAACAANSAGLETLSGERIGAEMRKLLAAPDPSRAVAAMAQSGVLVTILHGADARALAPLVHLEGDHPPRWQRRLAVLGGEDPAERLRLSRADTREIRLVRDEIGSMRTVQELAYRFGASIARDIVLVRSALLELPLPQNWQAAIGQGADARFPVCAADLMPGLQGLALGERLKALENLWIASGFTLSRAELLG